MLEVGRRDTMIDQFGQVMVYVNDVRMVADFWIQKMGFSEIHAGYMEEKLISIELAPNDHSDTHLVLFDKVFVAQYSSEVNLLSPSILFSTYDLEAMHTSLVEKGVKVGEIGNIGGMKKFNFPDPENNYFAVREISKGKV